jgi:glutathione S-transferase
MIKLFIFPPYWGMPSSSPFCIKVEAYLKMTKLPYQAIAISDPRKGPKGKLPYIEIDGNIIGDSHFIINHLEKNATTPLDHHLSESQKALSLITRRMLDEHLAWVIIYARWAPEKNAKMIKHTFFSAMPKLIRCLLFRRIRHYMLDSMKFQGISRHTEDEIYALGKEDIRALSALLGNNTYFFGNLPSTLDVTAYAYIASIIHAPTESPLKRFTLDQANLVNLCERIDDQYFKDS